MITITNDGRAREETSVGWFVKLFHSEEVGKELSHCKELGGYFVQSAKYPRSFI